VIEWTRANVQTIVRGNHDRSAVGLDDLTDYNPAARASAIWTRRAITPENRLYLEHLPRGPLRIEENGVALDLAHGSPLDEDDYLVNASDVALLRPYLAAQLTFIGHTHLQGGFLLTRGGAKRIAPYGVLQLEPDHWYLINPGSVGQPRDGDPRAAYAIYSPEQRTVEYRRTTYNIDQAAMKIRIAGLPEPLADRLFVGA
jgi:diadenosine tetraphosphatase ApaH/serine/threonine PP2A family protein phosphatase